MEPACSVGGVVVHGNHLGQKLGFPTANLKLPENESFPLPQGVYAVKAEVDQVIYRGMANAGFRPTVDGTTLTIEVHLFGFSGNLYGKFLRIDFYHRIREEIKFERLELLVEQLRKDKEEVLRLLS